VRECAAGIRCFGNQEFHHIKFSLAKSLASPFLSSSTSITQMNVVELNKLKKGELVELSTELQCERSELAELVATLKNSEAAHQEVAMNLQTEVADLKEHIAVIDGDKQLLE